MNAFRKSELHKSTIIFLKEILKSAVKREIDEVTEGQKKWQVTYIAPLQPFTLAAFLPWGSSIGAGRIRLAAAKIGEYDLRTTI